MAVIEPAEDKIVRHLQEAVERLHEDIARVELWAGALGCFAQPVPDYDPATSRFALPPKSPGGTKSKDKAARFTAREPFQSNGNSGRKTNPM